MTEWNYGDILDGVATVIPPQTPAYIHGDQLISWGEASARSNRLARALTARGAVPGDKIAFYMTNRSEYCELLAACFKGRFVHANVNYRYTADEVFYIFDNADAQTVVFGQEFRAQVDAIRPRLSKVKTFIEIGEGTDWAESFEALCAQGDGTPLGIKRSGSDMMFIYTGGTTGMPKGVMWTQHDLKMMSIIAASVLGPTPLTMEEMLVSMRQTGPGPASLIAPPLMHATGLISAIAAMLAGGTVITLEKPQYDAVELLDAVDRWRPQSLAIVGDPFARPIVEALDLEPKRWNMGSIARILSSGVMWSVEVKRALLRHMPQAVLADAFSSSEAMGLGTSLMTAAGETPTAKFMVTERTRVFDEHDQPVVPGSGVKGMVAVGPPVPTGYYKDAEKTARTFRMIDGVRYSIPGDWCVVEADGSMTLLGRGSACINTAGEKVFPEEVEEALKTHPGVMDALVIGLPDPKWGQSVNAVVTLNRGAIFDEAGMIAHVRQHLAGYKAPKRIVSGNVNLRAPNGKADYPAATEFAKRLLAGG